MATPPGARADLDGTLLAFIAMAETREPERISPHLAEIRCPVRLVIGNRAPRGWGRAEASAAPA